MSSDADPRRRESPAGRTVKTDDAQATAQATKQKTPAEGSPAQDVPRHLDNRVQYNATRSHKSIRRLPGSPNRTDSREQIYTAWDGQDHE